MLKTITKTLITLSVLAHNIPAHARNVIASVYHPDYHGGTTACGQYYNHWGISAAHRTIPCGTKVRVNYKGRSIMVPVNDRCACGERIDLSGGAARALGIPLNDIRPVTIGY